MRKSVSAARGARYNFERSLRLWKTALPRGGDLGRTVPWNGSPAARIWRIAVRAFNDASQNRFLSRSERMRRSQAERRKTGSRKSLSVEVDSVFLVAFKTRASHAG
jgi:hypothetical protein